MTRAVHLSRTQWQLLLGAVELAVSDPAVGPNAAHRLDGLLRQLRRLDVVASTITVHTT